MADESVFYGTWKIVECVSLAGTVEPTGIEGTLFQLDESGDVSWKVIDDAESMPFFNCESYEVSLGDPAILKFLGTFAGQPIEFRVEVSDDLMLLTYERCCMLQCQKICSNEPKDDMVFSLLEALSGGYFSDITITASNKKKFQVHKTILQLACPEVSWEESPTPLDGLSEDVLTTILHYLYAECLPSGLAESSAESCLKATAAIPGFQKFQHLCETFLKNTALKQQICSLVEDMHTCCDHVIDLFTGKIVNFAGDTSQLAMSEDQTLMSNPARLCYVVKQALREASVAGAKLLILCDLFSRRKNDLSREERHEIIKYAKSRLPVFMAQLHRFLEVCKQHCSRLSVAQKSDIAYYLVPEIESVLDLMSTFVVEVKTALEHVINQSSQDKNDRQERHKKAHVGEVLGRTLKHALHVRELRKLKHFHEKISESFQNLMRKRENFQLMSDEEKLRSVGKNLEQLIDEVPLFLIRIEELMAALDEKVTWAEWKYLFKLGTSKVSWVLGKMQTHESTLQSLIDKACNMAHRDQFTQSLAMVGLVPSSTTSQQQSQQPTTDRAASVTRPKITSQPKYAQLNAVESLCQSPFARDSLLASRLLALYKQQVGTDMTFEIIPVSDLGEVLDTSTDPSAVCTEAKSDPKPEVRLIPAHCVIIATRCDWFRRALLSGMRESIDKKITIHDTNPELFDLLLEYMYSGQLEMSDMSTEQLAEMITLSDRYDLGSLKRFCERSLKHHLNEDSALYLLGLADQFNASTLKTCALAYVVDHPAVVQSDIFDELPQHLKSEIEDMTWSGPGSAMKPLRLHSQTETPSSLSSASEMDDLVGGLDLADRSTSSSSEELGFMEDGSRLDDCISQLRDIVGDDVPRDELIRVALAADFDSNRALNFFFSAS